MARITVTKKTKALGRIWLPGNVYEVCDLRTCDEYLDRKDAAQRVAVKAAQAQAVKDGKAPGEALVAEVAGQTELEELLAAGAEQTDAPVGAIVEVA